MAVIKHEPPDLRRHVRSEVPIRVRIRGTEYLVKDWSLGGFRVEDFPAAGLGVGDRLIAALVVPHQGLEVSFTAEVEVVRLGGEDRTLAARFLHLNPREKEALGLAMQGRHLNGEGASLLESLARIDIPVTATAAVPTEREAPRPGRLRLALRRLFFTLFYWALGLGLAAVVGVTLYWHFFRLDLEYSVVSLPLYPVISQDVARCQEVYVKEGDAVRAGQPLFRVEDDVLTRDLELAEVQFAATKVDLETAEARVKKEREQVARYQGLTEAKRDRAQAQVESLDRQAKIARRLLDRALRVTESGATSQEDIDRREMTLAGLEGGLLQARAELRIAEQAVETLKHGEFYDQRRLVGDLPQYLVNLDDARERHRVAAKRLEFTRARAKRLTYHAPFDGRVVKLLKTPGGTMSRGEAVAILEKAGDEPVIDGFVTQDDASSLSLGTRADIWVPALDKTYQGQVVKIDRTSGFLTEMQAHLKDSQLRYNWRGQQDRSAYVQLAFTEPLTADEKKALAGGMPAVVTVGKQPALLHRLRSLFD
jgi:multidrug resistance efflux pump